MSLVEGHFSDELGVMSLIEGHFSDELGVISDESRRGAF